MTFHLNETILIGLGLFPAGVLLFWLAGVFLSIFMDLEAALYAGFLFAGCWIAGTVMVILGIGMEIH